MADTLPWFLLYVTTVSFFVVKTEHRGPLEKGFLISTSALPGVVRRTEGGEDGSPNYCFFQRCSVGTPLQPLFYGSRLLSATRALRDNRSVNLIGISLKEGV